MTLPYTTLPFREVKLVSVVSPGGSADVMEERDKGKSARLCNNLNLLPVWKSHFLLKRSLGSFVGPRGGFSLNLTRIQNPDPLTCGSPQIWLTFAPVATQTSQYLGVSLEEVNWFSLVFMVVAIPLTIGATWMIDTLGLRITVQTTATELLWAVATLFTTAV